MRSTYNLRQYIWKGKVKGYLQMEKMATKTLCFHQEFWLFESKDIALL